MGAAVRALPTSSVSRPSAPSGNITQSGLLGLVLPRTPPLGNGPYLPVPVSKSQTKQPLSPVEVLRVTSYWLNKHAWS